MKRLLITLALTIMAAATMAQTTMKEVRSVTFYGVDFTAAKIVGVEYRASDLIRAFGQINQAFVAAIDGFYSNVVGNSSTCHRTYSCIHTRCIASARQNSDCF